ncbi:hypothetical protein ABIE61_002742 [Marinobacterium sp. MBR-111]|jgi:hypothetical protein
MHVFMEPAVLISLFGSLIIAMLSSRLNVFGDFIIDHISIFPMKVKSFLCRFDWRYRKNIILKIRNPHRVTAAIIRTYAFLILFFLLFMFFIIIVIGFHVEEFSSLPLSVQMLVSSPVFIIEILWLIQREKTRSLIRAVGMRKKNKSRTCCQRDL